MLCCYILILNCSGLVFDLFGQPVMAHLCALRSMPDHLQNLSILFNWVSMDCRLSTRVARSSA